MQILEPTSPDVAGFAPRSPHAAEAELRSYGNDARGGDDARWQLALRISASRSLGRSQLLSDFLLYIVERSIQGRCDEITEQQIGVAVFGRAEDYNSNDDNIVRSYARKLRKRIDDYYASEGSEETLRLEIPRGGYTPIFTEGISSRALEAGAALDVELLEEELGEEPGSTRRESTTAAKIALASAGIQRRSVMPAILLALLLGIGLGVGAMLLKESRIFVSRADAASHTLWTQLFSGNRDTFIVPSDAGLVIMQRIVDRPVPLTNYVDGSYRTRLKGDNLLDVAEILKLGARRYTSVVDLDLAAHLAQLHEVVPGRMTHAPPVCSRSAYG